MYVELEKEAIDQSTGTSSAILKAMDTILEDVEGTTIRNVFAK